MKKQQKNQLKQVQNQTQQGRSMVEMLGVLAIIGVISIGGIAGYRMAMNRYQANQIANEINLMRTDAKMKTAQGAEKLMLGEPYDSGHLNLNSHYGVEFDFAVFSEAGEPEESGYYIKVSGVPAGVCKPLVTLLEGMDDAIAVVVNNDPENDADSSADLCTEESNALEVDFSTKDLGVSGGGKEEACDEATCEGYCSAEGACKECPEDAPWNEATKQCKCNSSSQHWNKEIEECAACGDNSHCTSSTKPACIEGVCSKCTEESQCDTAQNKHCKISTGQCITCGTSAPAAVWNETAQKCDYCKNVYPEKPNWTGSECVSECPTDKPFLYSNSQCVECLKNEDCEKEDEEHYYCDTDSFGNYGTCKICTYGWDETHGCKVGECESNADCGSGEYCYLYYGLNVSSEFNKNKGFGAGIGYYKSECRNASKDKIIGKKTGFALGWPPEVNGNHSMTWWSADRFCKALERPQATRESIGCGSVASGDTCSSQTRTDLKDDFSKTSDCVWLEDYGNSRSAYYVGLSSGRVSSSSRSLSNHYTSTGALCVDK